MKTFKDFLKAKCNYVRACALFPNTQQVKDTWESLKQMYKEVTLTENEKYLVQVELMHLARSTAPLRAVEQS